MLELSTAMCEMLSKEVIKSECCELGKGLFVLYLLIVHFGCLINMKAWDFLKSLSFAVTRVCFS